MVNSSLCPPLEELQEFARGDRESDEIDRHLLACPDCRRTVNASGDNQTDLLRLLRPVDATPVPADPALARLKAQVKVMQTASRLEVGEEWCAGIVMGDYELVKRIAMSGMGRVYMAWHRRLKRTVAIKTVVGGCRPRAELVARFRRETEALARLSHPNLVVAFDAFDDELGVRRPSPCLLVDQDSHDGLAGPYLVMEYIEGLNLTEWVREHGVPRVEQATDFILQAARGLGYAHEAGIIHRDIKPSNLMLDETNTIKVLDLGLARLTLRDGSSTDLELTGESHVMGTPAFMPPEQSLDARCADARSDIYSLGCTLYSLMTGRLVFEAASPMEMMLAHQVTPVPSLRAARADCPKALDLLFRRMVAKKPEQRPASMKEVIAELERIQKGGSLPRKRAFLIAALAAAVLVIGIFASPLLSPMKPDPDPKADPKTASAPVDVADMKLPRVEMVRIEPGKFFMGSTDDEKEAIPDERPRHEIRITRAFLLGKYEVTQEQYQEVMGVNPSSFNSRGRSKEQIKEIDTRRHPVESISWNDAVAFCNRLSERHGFQPYYRIEKNTVTVTGSNGYRLPTEAEWEFACRAETTTRWSFGNEVRDLDLYAWHAGNSDDVTHPVGMKRPNARGLYDMHGNVPEWCWDRYDARYYQKSPVSDPPGAGNGSTRAYRGGGWNMLGSQMRSAARNTLGTAYSVLTVVGMRVARDP